MTASRRPNFADGFAPTAADLNQAALGSDLFVQQILTALLGGRETEGTYGYEAATVSGATDANGAAVATFGFLGSALRVVRIDATHIRVAPGIGLQYATTGVPAGESALRVVQLDPTAPEFLTGISVTPAGSGNYRRSLVVTKWRDVTISESRPYIDAAGNAVPQTLAVRVKPEVGTVETGSSGILIVPGTDAASASAAVWPTVPSGYVVLAELLLNDTGLANAANPDGVTPGITDLRPRARSAKAAGGYDARRATCSIDETRGARGPRRLGAKAVGVDEVHGFAQMPTSSAAVVTLDTSRDWRDAMVDVTFTALGDLGNLPGGASDNAFTRNTVSNASAVEQTGAYSAIGRTIFYSAVGSVDGTTGPTSGTCRTAADHASTALIFFADSTTGALKVRGLAGGTLRELYFVASSRGPLGKRPATGVES